MSKFVEQLMLDTAIKNSNWSEVAYIMMLLYDVHESKQSDEALIIMNNCFAKLPIDGLMELRDRTKNPCPDMSRQCDIAIDNHINAAERMLEGL